MFKRSPFQMKTIACLVATIVGAPTMALAAGNQEVLETKTIEVVGVTPLQSLGVPINQVPANVQVVKGEAIREHQNIGVADYMNDSLLGVNVNETQNNPYQPDVNFHGFTASPLLGTPQGLSVYQDGVRVNEPFGDTVNWDLIPANAIAGISLMPGSNPLFGLNTLGGALSIQTKNGDQFPGGSLQAYAGSWQRRAIEGEYGGKLENGVNYFVSGNMFREDGWRDYSDTDVRQLFGKLGWKGEKTDFSVSFAGADNEMQGNGYTPQSFLNSLGYDSVYTQPDRTENKLGFVTGQFNHWFTDNLAFNGVAYYRHNRTQTYNADVAETPVVGVNEGVINRSKTQQNGYGITGQLSWNIDNNLLIAGLGYDRARIDFGQTSQEFSAFSASRGVGGTLDVVNQEVDLTGRSHTWSIFATDTYSLTSALALTASGRYNRTRVENHDQINPVAGTGSLTGSQTFSRFNPAAGLTYTPTASLNFYGGYNEGSRAPSSIEIGCSDPLSPCNLPNSMAGDPPTLKQVVAKTWEGGARGRLGSDVKWSVGAYTTKNDNDIQFIASNASGAGYFDNVGQTRRVGLDMGLDGKIGALKWMVGYSFVKATYESDFNVISASNALAGTDCQGNAAADTICVHSGDRLPGIPEHQFKLRGEYSVLPNWAVGANILAFSDQYARGNENNADPIGKIGGYGVLNMDTRYSFGNSGWQMFAKVNNVFDHEYYTGGILGENMFDAAGTFTGAGNVEKFLAPGAPRAGWVGLRYEFGGAKGSSRVDND